MDDSNVIDFVERQRRTTVHNLSIGGSHVVAVAMGNDRGVAILVPSGHDGIVLTPDEARSMATDLIECAGALEGREWVPKEEE